MTFDLELLPQHDIKQVTLPDRRYYETPDGKQYHSVTTLLGKLPDKKKWLSEWVARVGQKQANIIKAKAAARGEVIHNALEKYILGHSNYLKGIMPVHKVVILGLKERIDECITGPVMGVEQTMFSDTLKTAGTVDLVCHWRDEITVCDFKTSKRLKKSSDIIDYFLQATAYAIMLRELYGINAKNICILMYVDNEGVREFVEPVSKFEAAALKVFPQLAEK